MGQLADAFVIVNEIDTRSTVLARVVGAVVDVGLAIGAGVAGQALAAVTIQMVVARATVLTGV